MARSIDLANQPPTASLDLTGRRNRRYGDVLIKYVLIGCALITLLTTVGIVVVLCVEALNFFRAIPIGRFFTDRTWNPLSRGEQQEFGVMPLVAGTLMTSLVAALFALPFGLMAAIYLSEYAGGRARSVLKPVLELLAGVPTIVYGFFALKFITPVLLKPWLNVGTFNGLSAGIAIGIMILPMVASLSEDAIRAVPGSLREAAYALGATRFETSVRVVVPAAISGIIASFILAISRAVGETMIVALAAGSAPAGQTAQSGSMWDITQTMQTMTGFIAYTFSSDVARGTPQFYSLFGVGLLLFVMTFALNVVSQCVTNRFRKDYE